VPAIVERAVSHFRYGAGRRLDRSERRAGRLAPAVGRVELAALSMDGRLAKVGRARGPPDPIAIDRRNSPAAATLLLAGGAPSAGAEMRALMAQRRAAPATVVDALAQPTECARKT
jgi:hypothetical protein